MIGEGSISHIQRLIDGESAGFSAGIFALKESEERLIEASVYDPVICLILQGSKETTSHKGTVHLAKGDMLVVSHDTPVTARITQVPYLALILPIDLARIRSLADSIPDNPAPEQTDVMRATVADTDLLQTLSRLLSLEPGTTDDRVLTPLLLTELHYRLLTSPAGGMLRRLLSPTSQESRIARVASLIRRDHARPLRLADLAREAGMGQSAFHQHFKALTGTTPLQFQKDVRLSEALRLLEHGAQSVTEIGFAVGYESPAQFSREFSRRFGRPPRQVLQQQGIAAQ
ncbi:AraC family transcriptional regulator [Nioella aestuarii]|uniref:AraC family transcriptional regulator n=1 Tax=Nioella aestuarii TaxID=1662864 RepID=UPI003D7F9A64